MAPAGSVGAGAEAGLPEYAGHYRLQSRLGSGGMGVVHLARSTSGMRVAVKVVHAEYARDPEFRGRFRQEVAAARRVSGAFTAPVVDADPEAERPWMATLFIPGPTLAQQVKANGPLDAEQLRRLMAGLAEALRDIHRAGVVHRDLKPSNVLLAEDGPKVIDFGISRPKDSELRTETGKLIGTPPFMAPEQFRRPREVGPAADLFALGSVLVHAATGRGPFDSDSPYVVAYQVVHDEPDVTGLPDSLVPLVLRCLAKEPEDRPTPDELMRELRSSAASLDTQPFIPAQRIGVLDERTDTAAPTDSGTESPDGAPPGSPADGAPPAPRRRPSRRTLVVTASAVAVLAGGVLTPLARPDDAPAPRTSATPTASAPAASGGWRGKPLAGGTGVPVCGTGGGRLFCARAGQVVALDPADGRVVWRRAFPGARWDGPPVVSGGLLHLVAAGTGHLEALDPASGRTRWRQALPGDSGVAYAAGSLLLTRADGTVTGVDGASGRTLWHRRLPGGVRPEVSAFAGGGTAYATRVAGDGGESRVAALDPATGEVRWDAALKGTLSPAGAGDGAVVFLAADPVYGDTGAVVRRDASGTATRTALPAPRQGAQAAVHGDVVYLLGSDGALDAIDSRAGRRLWHLETAVSYGSAPVTDGRYVYLSAGDGRLLAVGARDGRLVGQTRARPGPSGRGAPATLPAPLLGDEHGGGQRVFGTAPDGTVFAEDTRDPASW